MTRRILRAGIYLWLFAIGFCIAYFGIKYGVDFTGWNDGVRYFVQDAVPIIAGAMLMLASCGNSVK